MIGAEIAAAKTSAKATWQGVKVVVYAVALFALAGYVWWQWSQGVARDKRLQGLEQYRDSVQARQQVSDAGTKALAEAQSHADETKNQQAQVIVIHDQKTREAADEDPDTAAWLHGAIPQRLRDADAAARRSGRLGQGDR